MKPGTVANDSPCTVEPLPLVRQQRAWLRPPAKKPVGKGKIDITTFAGAHSPVPTPVTAAVAIVAVTGFRLQEGVA
jgi:hypothetical protein